jgi:glycerate-2-kinase
MKYLYCDDVKEIASTIPPNQYEEFVKVCEKYGREHATRIKEYLSSKRIITPSQMKRDLRKMVNNQLFSDVSFKVNNEIIHSHKVISLSTHTKHTQISY